MKFIIQRIGFKENKPCRCCDKPTLAYYQIGNTYFCERHMKGFIEFKKELEK